MNSARYQHTCLTGYKSIVTNWAILPRLGHLSRGGDKKKKNLPYQRLQWLSAIRQPNYEYSGGCLDSLIYTLDLLPYDCMLETLTLIYDCVWAWVQWPQGEGGAGTRENTVCILQAQSSSKNKGSINHRDLPDTAAICRWLPGNHTQQVSTYQ